MPFTYLLLISFLCFYGVSTRKALPLYYTGLTDAVMVTVNGTAPVKMQLERDYFLLLKLEMGSSSYTTILFSVP
jgi:hypothetical protein